MKRDEMSEEYTSKVWSPSHMAELGLRKAFKAGWDARDSEISRLQERLDAIQKLVDEQAEDLGLWSTPFARTHTIAEAHLQQELRRLHEVIEVRSQEQCAREALKGEK